MLSWSGFALTRRSFPLLLAGFFGASFSISAHGAQFSSCLNHYPEHCTPHLAGLGMSAPCWRTGVLFPPPLRDCIVGRVCAVTHATLLQEIPKKTERTGGGLVMCMNWWEGASAICWQRVRWMLLPGHLSLGFFALSSQHSTVAYGCAGPAGTPGLVIPTVHAQGAVLGSFQTLSLHTEHQLCILCEASAGVSCYGNEGAHVWALGMTDSLWGIQWISSCVQCKGMGEAGCCL